MKIKCMGCGLILEKYLSLRCVCPACGSSSWYRFGHEEEIDKTEKKIDDLYKATLDFVVREWLKENGYIVTEKMGVPENPYLPKDYTRRIIKKEEGLAFEIFQVKNGNKIKNRKIYLNGHIEGFKGNPCVINHIAPKIMALKCLLQQMNKDYRDLIETYMIRGLPIDNVPLHELYIKELERIENIKI